MIDNKSILGYSRNSPYQNDPFIDIFTPEGLIDMSNTPVDLIGIDNKGNKKKMKALSKNPYKFEGDVVRETRVGNPFMQKGGMTQAQIFDFIFDDEEEAPKKEIPTAPTTEEIDEQGLADMEEGRRRFQDAEQYALAMSAIEGNPYQRKNLNQGDYTATKIIGNPYQGQIISSGQFGNKNIGDYGKQIYGQVAQDLGYSPVANSIYRSREQQDALIAAGKPAAKNSWHLTGNAIDFKPADWNKLPEDRKQFYKTNYKVIYHDNHFHVEPRK